MRKRRNQFIGTLLLLGTFLFVSFLHAKDDFYRLRGGIPNSLYYYDTHPDGLPYTFFIGGSVLDGKNLSRDDLRYSWQLNDVFAKHFPDAQVLETRNIDSGGSEFAKFRIGWGTAVFGEIICSGHLAILDFAAQDRNASEEDIRRNIETILRQIILYRDTHNTILVITLTPEIFEAYRTGQTPSYVRICEEIADHYAVPTLNLAKFAAEKILAGEMTWDEFTTDGVTPTDSGATLYDEAARRFAEALIEEGTIPDEPIHQTLPSPLIPNLKAENRIAAYEEGIWSDGWKSGTESPVKPFRHLLISETVGATFTIDFDGTGVGLMDVVGPDSPDLEYAIDQGPTKRLAAPKDATEYRTRNILFDEFLSDGAHRLTLKMVSPGVARIGGILLNGHVVKRNPPKTRLEEIDRLYAGMDPIGYTPESGCFKAIPTTMEKLQNGPSLRMVLLGDSIIGNTAASDFDLLLERLYPRCDVEKIVSTRGSTGCWFYKDDNRIESYVLRYDPDLLVIGGISNREDSESVRSVVRQVRAQRPDQEILILTPVFGAPHCEHFQNWRYDPPEGSFRARLKQVAQEENCAFFDINGPWWQYILDSGKTYGWFMGDSVHANARGSQILGRLLEKWFTSDSKRTELPAASDLWLAEKFLADPPTFEIAGDVDGLVTPIFYDGPDYQQKPTKIFAYLGKPSGGGPFPAVLLIHGGGGTAFPEWARYWAERGYVALAMDLAGCGFEQKRHENGGPDQSDETKFRDFSEDDYSDVWTWQAIAAILRGHALLKTLPEVDSKRIAATGISWGGYLTAILSGVDPEIRCFVPVYGCGFLHEDSVWKANNFDKMTPERRERWVRLFDPSSHLGRSIAPTLWVNGTNDFAYPFESYRKSYRLPAGPRFVAIALDRPHGHIWTFPEVDAFIDNQIGGDGVLPLLAVGPTLLTGETATATVSGEVKPVTAEFLWTADTGRWSEKKWQTFPVAIQDGRVIATVPSEAKFFFFNVTDERGLTVSSEYEARP